jgi:hypothetical protein
MMQLQGTRVITYNIEVRSTSGRFGSQSIPEAVKRNSDNVGAEQHLYDHPIFLPVENIQYIVKC